NFAAISAKLRKFVNPNTAISRRLTMFLARLCALGTASFEIGDVPGHGVTPRFACDWRTLMAYRMYFVDALCPLVSPARDPLRLTKVRSVMIGPFLCTAALIPAPLATALAHDPTGNNAKATASKFDPVTVPPIESIDARTDITAFLQAGVPASLQRAALRCAWTTDPAIRDFKGLQESDWD